MLSVTEALNRRQSTRAFRSDPVSRDLVVEILDIARRTPSGGNLQPWQVHVVTGTAQEELKALVAAKMQAGEVEKPEYDVYPPQLWDPFRRRRRDTGAQRYAALGVSEKDKDALQRLSAANYAFFGAPVGLFFSLDRRLGPPQWSDVGMYMLSVMLLATERGLDTCPQESWSNWPQTLRAFLMLPEDHMLFAGMSLGYRDVDHPLNAIRTDREAVESFVWFVDR